MNISQEIDASDDVSDGFSEDDLAKLAGLEVDEPEEAEASPEAEEAEAKKVEPEEATPETEGDPEGVLTKNGKHVLDYSVLTDSRAETRAQRERADALEQQLQEAKAALESKQAAEAQARDQLDGDELEEALREIEEDAPEGLSKIIRTLNARTAEAEAKANRLEESTKAEAERQRQDSEQAQADQEQAEALAAMQDTPLLAKWVKSGGPLLDQANHISDRMIAAYKDGEKPSREDHYKAVEAEMRSVLGLSDATGSDKPKAVPPLGGNDVPTSLSNLSGGDSPESGTGALEGMGAMDIASKLSGLSEAEQDQLIQRQFL